MVRTTLQDHKRRTAGNSYSWHSVMVPPCESRLKRCVAIVHYCQFIADDLVQMEITQHARYTCTFCGKVNNDRAVLSRSTSLIYITSLSGHRQAYRSWHLELQLVQKGHCRRCMDRINNRRRYCSQVSSYTYAALALFLIRIFPVLCVGCERSPRHKCSRTVVMLSSLFYTYKFNHYDQHDHSYEQLYLLGAR